MCGLFAALGPTISASTRDRVTDVLRHRGPDGEGCHVDESAKLTLIHTRLAVIDRETGAQPLYSDQGDLVLICNGEIYDFERIRTSLEAKGHNFRTRSDSEVILALYERDRLGCFEHLRGEFAFLLHDRRRRLLIAARDRFGIKPLYFSRLDTGFVFASEMKAIFASGLVKAKLDAAGLDPLLDRDPERAHFPFDGIAHVPPASYVAIDLDTHEARTVQYWSARIPSQSADPLTAPTAEARSSAAQLVLRELEEAVRLRLRADVPVGLYLSGGIDSSFVGALMQRNLSTRLHSFSISFAGSQNDERKFALRAAEALGTEHHELSVTKEMLWANLDQCLWHSELPFVTLAPVGKFLLSGEARRFVTVVLTGEGADEVFLGYRGYFAKAIAETRSGRSPRPAASLRMRRFNAGWAGPATARRLSLLLFDKRHRRRLRAARSEQASARETSEPLINSVQEARLAGMPFDILCYLGDREEMAHSLEARLPFLDHKLYDAAKWIPVDLKMRDGIEKAVVRDAAEGILPDDLRRRRKQGFMVTSEAIDLFGADRQVTAAIRREYLSKAAFDRAGIFSYRFCRLLCLLARLPAARRFPRLARLRRNANKVLMYFMQTHMLERMFMSEPV